MFMVARPSQSLSQALSLLVPGRPLREALDRILQAKRGALIVIGDGPNVLGICSGGFILDTELVPQRLAELAKMDGAIVLSRDATRIARANVHLVPDASIPTSETGTRHRTAERVAKSLKLPVISVSAAMNVVTVYLGDEKHVVRSVSWLIDRANQALQVLERFRQRLDLVLVGLSASEVEDSVTLRDVTTALQRAEMVRRIAEEAQDHLLQLGEDAGLLRFQLQELTEGVDEERMLILKDYVARGRRPEAASKELEGLAPEALLDLLLVGRVLGFQGDDLDIPVEPRGYRMLHRIPRFPEALVDRIVAQFSSLQKIMRASVGDLEEVGGVGAARARAVKDHLARLTQSSIFERYSS
jgi:diadenylate cyclase